jgi:hypothetical protein
VPNDPKVYRMVITYEPAKNGRVEVDGPLDQPSVCDVMLESARRFVMQFYLESQFNLERRRIQVARPVDPMAATARDGRKN